MPLLLLLLVVQYPLFLYASNKTGKVSPATDDNYNDAFDVFFKNLV